MFWVIETMKDRECTVCGRQAHKYVFSTSPFPTGANFCKKHLEEWLEKAKVYGKKKDNKSEKKE